MLRVGLCSLDRRSQCLSSISVLCITIRILLLLVFNDCMVLAQIGVNLCACQPSTYTMTFNFTLRCEDFNVTGPGIVPPPGCITEIRGQQVVNRTELVPISVQSIQIYELDQNLQVVAQTLREGNYLDGSSFTYTSIIATQTDQLNPTSLPQGFQLSITGLNTQEESVVQTYIIRYTNDCGIFPVLVEGQTAGWTIFSDLGSPPTAVCSAAPSLAPTTPSNNTIAPSQSPISISPIAPAQPIAVPIISPIAPVQPIAVPVQPPLPIATPISPPRQLLQPDCPPIYVDSTKRGNDGIGNGKGKGDQKKTMDKSDGSMSKLSQKTKGSRRRLGVHNNRPVRPPFVCPEIPKNNNNNRPVQSPKINTGGKGGDTITTKVKPSSLNSGNGGKGGGGSDNSEQSTKTMFSKKKTKIIDHADRTKPGKEEENKEGQKKSMR